MTSERQRERWRRYDARHREKRRRSGVERMRLLRCGVTSEDVAQQLACQDGLCAICGADSPGWRGDWHVDHDHKTGRVRGVLCIHCNTLLGRAKDSPAILHSAIRYLSLSPAPAL